MYLKKRNPRKSCFLKLKTPVCSRAPCVIVVIFENCCNFDFLRIKKNTFIESETAKFIFTMTFGVVNIKIESKTVKFIYIMTFRIVNTHCQIFLFRFKVISWYIYINICKDTFSRDIQAVDRENLTPRFFTK